jgi:hypothetical protein
MMQGGCAARKDFREDGFRIALSQYPACIERPVIFRSLASASSKPLK